MNTRKELGWWLEFAQKDLSAAKAKTINRFIADIAAKLYGYNNPFKKDKRPEHELINVMLDGADDEVVAYPDSMKTLLSFQGNAERIIQLIKDWLEHDPKAKDPFVILDISTELVIQVRSIHGGFRSEGVRLLKDSTEEPAFWMSMFMDGTKREDYGFCEYCGNLFLRVSQKNKRYCTTYCTDRASKQKKKATT